LAVSGLPCQQRASRRQQFAAITKRIRVGTYLVLLPLHNAVRVAEDAATIVVETAGEWSRRLQSEADRSAALSELVDKVELKPGGIELSINLPLSVDGTHGATAMLSVTRFIALRMKRRGVEKRLIIEGAEAMPRVPDDSLLKAIARAHQWFEEPLRYRVDRMGQLAALLVVATHAAFFRTSFP